VNSAAFRVTCLALALLGTVATAGDDPAFERRVWVDVENEDLRNVVSTLGSMVDPGRVIADTLHGRVTVRLENVTLRTALTAICESAGCTWEVVGDGPGRLRFAGVPLPPTPTPIDPGSTPVSLVFQRTPIAGVVDALARMAGLRLVADPPLSTEPLTLQLQEAHLDDVLDTLCKLQGLEWRIAGDELRITKAP
jgi:type II secretory pathway component GspD/PulD (secretin)